MLPAPQIDWSRPFCGERATSVICNTALGSPGACSRRIRILQKVRCPVQRDKGFPVASPSGTIE
jgi:hypothetical protein